jgi:dihydrodipicolinate synthase/N-acetylneuraminate lyase
MTGNRRNFLRSFLQVAGGGALALSAWPAAEGKPLAGVFPIAFSPFTEQDKLDLNGLAAEVRFCNRGGVHGLVWPQIASSWSTLSDSERLDGTEAIVTAGGGGKTAIVIGVQSPDMANIRRYAKHAEKLGADAIISLPPAGITDEKVLLDFYGQVGRMTALPLFAQTTGAMSVDLLVEMSGAIPTFRCVKDEAGDPLTRIEEIRRRTDGKLKVFSGFGVQTMITEMQLGFSGHCPYTNLADVYASAYNLWAQAAEMPDRFQQWRYRWIDGVGTNVIIEFVDPTMSGEFHMTMDPSEKDALLYVPNAGLTTLEQMGITDKTQRFNNTDGTHMAQPLGGLPESMNEFTRLEQYVNLQKPPKIKFTDLESQVDSRITYNILPMKVRVDFFPVTDASVMTYVTVQFDNKDLQLKNKDGVSTADIHLFGEFTTISRKIVQSFEQDMEIDGGPRQYLTDWAQRRSVGQKSVPLKPGTYRLVVVCKDQIGGNVNNWEQTVTVPRLDPDQLSTSTLILADSIEPVPLRGIGTGQFVIGGTKVRPRIGAIFRRDETLGIYMKMYNFGTDEQTRKPNGQVQYEVVRAGTPEPIVTLTEDVSKIPEASGSQVTIEKLLKLEKFEPGSYTLRLKIVDKNRNQTLTQSAPFTVT